MTSEQIKQKIQDSFYNLNFEEISHTYSKGFKNYIPVSNKIKEFYKEFETDRIAENYAKKRNLNKQDVLKQWEEKRISSSELGKRIHAFAEEWIKTKPYIADFGDDSDQEYKKSVIRFWSELPNQYSCILTEQKMYSDVYGYAGTTDFLLYDEREGSVIVGDYKTNSDLFKKAYGYLHHPFDNFEENSYNKYQIQLSLYQILLEDIGIPVTNRVIVWLTKEGYKIFNPLNLTKQLREHYADTRSNTISPVTIL